MDGGLPQEFNEGTTEGVGEASSAGETAIPLTGPEAERALQRMQAALTTHRMQFFPEDFWDMSQLKWCPHVYRLNKVLWTPP